MNFFSLNNKLNTFRVVKLSNHGGNILSSKSQSNKIRQCFWVRKWDNTIIISYFPGYIASKFLCFHYTIEWNYWKKTQNFTRNIQDSLYQSHLPIQYWRECLLTFIYLINRFSSRILPDRTPFQVLFKTKPSYINLSWFGCLCFVTTLPSHRYILNPREVSCVFLVYAHEKKGQQSQTPKSFLKVLFLLTN